MTISPLDAIPAPSPYPRTSRYYGIGTAVHTAPDGREVPYLRRRPLPQPTALAQIAEHVVTQADRSDLLANRYFGDAGLWWRIADANPVLHPRELTDTPGRRIRITLPEGVPGTAMSAVEMG
ncbi:LysM domain-containing protein [Actinomadura sp. HBU206391]|uniref:LysM domain-containing protein n=1 Tax=Actinomadura sp. HBU206391 TaxID=2731692 RepID=UPI0016504B39|nr:LysM domain-containing protein [Actinomadura sp. HBU206391]MBC6463313.1 LysM domain-containing protein [Actinomadura sp. HBU206391]